MFGYNGQMAPFRGIEKPWKLSTRLLGSFTGYFGHGVYSVRSRTEVNAYPFGQGSA
jgi:hypothetical protein